MAEVNAEDIQAMVSLLVENGFPTDTTTEAERANYLGSMWLGDTASTVSQIITNYYNALDGGEQVMEAFLATIRAAPDWEGIPPPPPRVHSAVSTNVREQELQTEIPMQNIYIGGSKRNRAESFPVDNDIRESDDDRDNADLCCTWDPRGVCNDLNDLDTCIKLICCGTWTAIIVILAIILIACSVETIDSTEMGIAYNAPQAILSAEVKEEGLHGKPPFGYYILWPRTHQTLLQTVTGMSKDGVIVQVEVAFQYKIMETQLLKLTMDYVEIENYQKILRLKSRSGIRNACMKYTAQEFQTKRSAVQQAMTDAVNKRLTDGGMEATMYDLQLTKVDRPPTYELAVDAKENAKNTIDLVQNQKTQKITAAETSKMRIVVEANKTLDAAKTAALVATKNSQTEAAIVYGKYASQGAMYKIVRSERNLTSEGLLSYIGTRLIDELSHLTVGIAAPARVSYGTALSNTTIRL